MNVFLDTTPPLDSAACDVLAVTVPTLGYIKNKTTVAHPQQEDLARLPGTQ